MASKSGDAKSNRTGVLRSSEFENAGYSILATSEMEKAKVLERKTTYQQARRWREEFKTRPSREVGGPHYRIWISGPIQRLLRQAIREQLRNPKMTRYTIAKRCGIGYKVLTRFLDEGTDIQLSTVEVLAEYLGLELKPK